MKSWHLAIVFLIGYIVAIYFPGPGAALRAKVGM